MSTFRHRRHVNFFNDTPWVTDSESETMRLTTSGLGPRNGADNNYEW